MVSDIIIIATIILFIVIGVNRGFARTVIGIVCFVISAFLAESFAGNISQFIYDSCIKDAITQNVYSFIEANGVDAALNNCVDALPDWLGGIVSFMGSILGVDWSGFAFDINSSVASASEIAVEAIETAVSPLIITLLRIIFLILLFVLSSFILRKIAKLVLKLFNIPIIKQVNQFLGGIAGLIEGIVFVFILVNLFWSFVDVANSPFATDPEVLGSVFNFFCFE